MAFAIEDLARWGGHLPAVLVARVSTAADRRQAFRDFTRRVAADEEADIRHVEGHSPRLLGHPWLHLSTASRDGLAAFAAAHDPVGIDVERVDPDGKLALGVLHPAERDALARCPDLARPHAFAATWACKEAYLKALGTGLSRDPASFRVDLAPPGPIVHDGPHRIRIAIEEHRLDAATFLVAFVTLPRSGA